MSQSGKSNLENFFRKRAQNHHPVFDETDWLKLKERLDNEMPVGFTFWSSIRKFWYVLIIMISVPVLWIAYSEFDKSSPHISNSNISEVQQIKATEENFKFEDRAETIWNSTAKEVSEKPVIAGNKKTISNKNAPSLSSSELKKGSFSKIKNTNDNKIVINEGDENSNEIGYADFENGAKFKGQILNFKLHFLEPISPVSTSFPGDIQIETLEISNPDKLRNRKSKPYFSLGVGYSPDFSTVGLGNFIAPGSRWKVLAEFSFLKRWSINSGIVFVNNKYEAYGEDYQAPSRYWKNGIVASEAYGECKMIDIPLNLRYDVISRQGHKFFISAGASSYMVTNEEYYFQYELVAPDLPSHWGTEKMTAYPFGIIHVSMGYDYNVNRKSALQVEPFIKIPTTGIGWGNVDLYTIGMYFMYRYRIGK